jgi:hypothetical protein
MFNRKKLPIVLNQRIAYNIKEELQTYIKQKTLISPRIPNPMVPNQLRGTDDDTKWRFILSEMIYAFDAVYNPFYYEEKFMLDEDSDGIVKFDQVAIDKHDKRVEQGLLYFAEYIQELQ